MTTSDFAGRRYSSSAVKQIFNQKEEFLIVGLTGRTGSGCTTVAGILSTEKFEDLYLPLPYESSFTHVDQRKYRVIYKYSKQHWSQFRIIAMSVVIATYIFENSYESLSEFIKSSVTILTDNQEVLKQLEELYNEADFKALQELLKAQLKSDRRLPRDDRNAENTTMIYEKSQEYFDKLREILKKHQCKPSNRAQDDNRSNLYSFLFQTFGNNIRISGTALNLEESDGKVHIFELACRTNDIIKAYRAADKKESKCTHICIDSIRNPYEAIFFQERYAAFYLISVKCTEDDRVKRLTQLSNQEIRNIDNIEYPDQRSGTDTFTMQNIAACIQLSDIHFYNSHCTTKPEKNQFLMKQIITYITLMLHPGLVTPSPIERCMQVAYNAKLNSGCLSRQVGAVVTDQDFSIKSIGWNDVASGQIPCNLRDVRALCKYQDKASHSRFEIENQDFQEFLSEQYNENTYEDLDGRLYPYCFSEMFNKYNARKRGAINVAYTKNQVYTRALHAEENAFLQIAKYGGQGIRNGYLFVTASPCELCSKKAYQLGIKRIYYIDPYPGIAKDQILDFGSEPESNPEMCLFFGITGKAYTQLFSPRLPFKDEIASIIDTDRRSVSKENVQKE